MTEVTNFRDAKRAKDTEKRWQSWLSGKDCPSIAKPSIDLWISGHLVVQDAYDDIYRTKMLQEAKRSGKMKMAFSPEVLAHEMTVRLCRYSSAIRLNPECEPVRPLIGTEGPRRIVWTFYRIHTDDSIPITLEQALGRYLNGINDAVQAVLDNRNLPSESMTLWDEEPARAVEEPGLPPLEDRKRKAAEGLHDPPPPDDNNVIKLF